jgi:cytoskeletal protein CcmA (bactofilin family)
MFTIRPAGKNGLWSRLGTASHGHKQGNGNGHGNSHNGNGNGNGKGGTSPLGGGKIETVLGPGVHYKGTLSGTGGVRIEGSFDGTIALKGPLVIGDGAKITAAIQAGAVSVAGNVKGNITAGKVEILSTGRVWGDLVTSAFATEEGAFLRGQVTMQDEVPPPEGVEATQPHEAVVA